MSDHWEVYMAKDQTLIRVDYGINAEAPIPGADTLVKVSLNTKSLFSKKLDFTLIGQVEDELYEQLSEQDYLVGAITYGDSKSFFVYTKQKDAFIALLHRILASYKKVKSDISTTDDPQWNFYMQQLFPDEYEHQWIRDWKVVDQLKANQDQQHIPREVRHWIYFPESVSKESFRKSIQSGPYKMEEETELEDHPEMKFQLIISHHTAVDFETIHQHTTGLLQKATAAGGNYDGWESRVVKTDERN